MEPVKTEVNPKPNRLPDLSETQTNPNLRRESPVAAAPVDVSPPDASLRDELPPEPSTYRVVMESPLSQTSDRVLVSAFVALTLGALVLTSVSLFNAWNAKPGVEPLALATTPRPVLEEIARREAQRTLDAFTIRVEPGELPLGEDPAPPEIFDGEDTGADFLGTSASSDRPVAASALMDSADRSYSQSRWSDALNQYGRVADSEPMRMAAHIGISRTLLELGRPEAAISRLQRAKNLNPSSVELEFWLAEAYAQVGQSDEAVRHYLRYLDADPNGTHAHEARRAIPLVKPVSPSS
ncbi:MAG: tetratricopeptide repeat protein [Deltaproteobacteria bacterium]|nr:tetratricopeptide repeat protein [Deltaproteobacteria bacterium]